MKNAFLSSWAACLVLAGVAVAQSANAQDEIYVQAPESYRAEAPDSVYFQFAGMMPTSYMGVNLADIDSDRAHALKLRDVHGVEITRIEENSPAQKAGIKVGDVVLEYNGQRVEGMEQFGRFVRETPVGREVKLVISREGNQMTIPVTIGARKDMMRGPELFGAMPGGREYHFNMPEVKIPMPEFPQVFGSWRSAVLGVEAETLSPQLAEFFGVKEGVLVRSVLRDSPAERAGIKAGDVITKVEQQKVATPSELSSALAAARSKATFPLQIVRDHKDVTLSVTVNKSGPEGAILPRVRIVNSQPAKM